MKKIKLSKYITCIFQTPHDIGSWFGYYNYDPLNHNQTKMLSIRTKDDAVPIVKGMKVEIGYYNLKTEQWNQISESDSYNYPQGAMLQWLPGKGNEDKIIFNTSDGKHNIAKIIDINTYEERTISWSIYGLTPDGKKSIALNMERSHYCRAYHYESIANSEYNVRVAKDDGIFEIDLVHNTRKRIVKIQDVINTDYEEYFKSATHWLEHIMINPSGTRFCFLHRFTIGELNDYETRLFIANIDGSNLQIIDGWKDFYWSHFGWDGDDAFSIYSYKSDIHKKITNQVKTASNFSTRQRRKTNILHNIGHCLFSLLPPHYRFEMRIRIKGQRSYYQYYTCSDNGLFKLKENWKYRFFDIDGHPSFTNDGRYMITDSYPTPSRFHRLIVFDKSTHKSIILGELYAALYKKPGSCDLHPKLCKNNTYLVVDSADGGRHHMLLFKINWDSIRKEINI